MFQLSPFQRLASSHLSLANLPRLPDTTGRTVSRPAPAPSCSCTACVSANGSEGLFVLLWCQSWTRFAWQCPAFLESPLFQLQPPFLCLFGASLGENGSVHWPWGVFPKSKPELATYLSHSFKRNIYFYNMNCSYTFMKGNKKTQDAKIILLLH